MFQVNTIVTRQLFNYFLGDIGSEFVSESHFTADRLIYISVEAGSSTSCIQQTLISFFHQIAELFTLIKPPTAVSCVQKEDDCLESFVGSSRFLLRFK